MVIRNSQYGFTKGKSRLVDPIVFHSETKSSMDVVYLDFNRAFSSVSPDILIDKLMKSGW